MKEQEKQQETKEVKQERRSYLVNNGAASQWVEEARFLQERDRPETPWAPVLKDGEPVVQVTSSKTVKLYHLRSADGAIDEWAREADLEEKLRNGWKKVMI